MKTIRLINIFILAGIFALAALPLWGQDPTPPSPHPYDVPAINFQGRIEEGDIGFSGAARFRFTIGNTDMSDIYWGGEEAWAATTVVEGIYNVIIGQDTNIPLEKTTFNEITDYFLKVEFSTDGGTYYETLEPYQEILTVPFAANADLLDGREAPGSDIVGVSDAQTLTSKTLTDPVLTRPVIDSTYFIVTPGSLPDDPAEGYIAYDEAESAFSYWNGEEWVSWGEGGTGITGEGEDGYVTYWTGPQTISGDSALMYDTENYGHLTLDSPATTGTAFTITADDLTTGSALGVSSTAADTAYDLVTFTASTGRALNIEHSGGQGGDDGATVRIARDSDGRALSITGANVGQQTVYISSGTATSGNLLYISATSDLTSGAGIYVNQASTTASGNAIYAQVAGTGKGFYSNVVAGDGDGANALWINQDDVSDDLITDAEGGALHVINSGNIYGGITLYSNQDDTQAAPLMTVKTTAVAFDQALLKLDPAVTGNAPHLWLKAIDGPTPESAQAGMIYMNTDGYLYFYNGTDWIALTGDSGVTGDFANVELDNLSSVAVNTALLPDDDNTIDLGSTDYSWADLHVDGTANLATVDIDGGTIDDTIIGGTTPSEGTFTSLTADTAYLGAGATITEFSTDTTLAGDDTEVPTELAVKTYVDEAIAGNAAARWVDQTFEVVDVDSFDGDAGVFKAGVPIRYSDGLDFWRYGMVVDCTAGDGCGAGPINLAGYPLSGDCDTMQSGNPEMVRQVNLISLGNLSPGTNWGPPNIWKLEESYVVQATAKLTFAAGEGGAQISVGIGGEALDLLNNPLDLGMETYPVVSGTDINTDNYEIQYGEKIYVNVDGAGQAEAPGTDLLVILDVVTP